MNLRTGPSTNWEYSAGKWIEDLQPYVDNAKLTSPDWDFEDIFSNAVGVNRWTGQEFGGLGKGALYAIPMIGCVERRPENIPKNSAMPPGSAKQGAITRCLARPVRS